METTLKNIVLAGIGSLAYTYEKGAELIDELVKKGEFTMSQGKQMNEELKRKMQNNKPFSQAGSAITIETLRETIANMGLATKQDLEELKQRINQLENKLVP
ncbi:MAG: phasin family protein [Acetivibrionales bacterium]